jgi:hypothetical protein
MNKCKGTLFRTIATRAVIAVIPVAMVSAYASGIFVSPPRMAAYEYAQVAEITQTPNTIGMAESPLYGMSQADINATLDQLQSIGVQNIRVFVPWGLIEQRDNAYDFTYLDRVMSAAAARNMGVMAEINGTPTWAGPSPGNPGLPLGSDTPNVAAFTGFLNQLMAQKVSVNGVEVTYKSIVSAYEIWNEPNYFVFSNPVSPEAYATLLKAAYEAINTEGTGDPTATVVAGAVGATQTFPPVSGSITMDPVTFVTRMLAALGPNPGQYFDALSVHPYSDQIPFSGTCPTCGVFLTPREQVEAIMNLIGPTKQVWLSEYGVSSTNPASNAQQAAWIKDLLDTWQTYDQAGPVFLYTARDTAGSTDPGANMGVWKSVGGEKVYVDGNGVSHTVSEMLKDWIAAHPTPTTPTTPTTPGIPILNPIAALVQALVAGVQAFVTSVVSAITNFLGGIAGVLSGPAAAAAAVASFAPRSASVQSADTEGLAAESQATTADGKGAEATEKTATDKTATEQTAAEQTAAEETAAEETAAAGTPTASTETAAAKATETAVPVKVTEPVTVTEPVKTEPVKTEPTGTTGTTTETSSTGTSTGSTTPGSSTEAGSKSDESGKPSDSDKSGEPTKSGSGKSGSSKSGASEGQSKLGKDGDEGRRTRGKDGSGSAEVKAKPVTVSAGVGAAGAEGGEGASDSAGGAAS